MAVESRKTKQGLRHRAYWNNPYTGRRERGPWEITRDAAERLSDHVAYRLRHERESFLPLADAVRSTDMRVADVLFLYNAGAPMSPVTRRQDFYHMRVLVRDLGACPLLS